MKVSESIKTDSCPACGESLPADSPRGLCPACLMAGAMEPTAFDSSQSGSPKASAPDIEAIRLAFPQFEVIELIGAGGMGAVYEARQPRLERTVALKILTVGDRDSRFAERFQQEAKTLAKLSHPNIVTVFDYGEAGGFYFLLMEFVEGLNLRQIMGAERLAPEQALAIVPPVCEALQYAHDHGVVHRDIKPENILMDREGRVKIADFGIARLLEAEGLPAPESDGEANASRRGVGLTSEVILGTPRYMAPEQAATPQSVDHRADIYSLGVVLYEMLTGEKPDASLTPPSRRVEVDGRLDEVVLRALSQNPEERYQSATDLKTKLQSLTIAPSTPGVSDARSAHVDPAVVKRRRIIAAASAVLALFVLLGFRSVQGFLIVLSAGAIAFAWFSRKPIPAASAFSRSARVFLAMALAPVIFVMASLLFHVVPNDPMSAPSNEPAPPESRRLTIPGHSVVTVDDGLRTHYAFHYSGDITTVSGLSQGGTRERKEWSRDGILALPSGQRIEYERRSSNPAELSVDGKVWDLKLGAILHVEPDGAIEQLPIFPPLITEDNVAKWVSEIEKIRQ